MFPRLTTTRAALLPPRKNGDYMMKNVEKWLQKNGISYSTDARRNNEYIFITLEKDCVWVNGFGEEMLWDHTISIFRSGAYKNYIVTEKTGYSLSHTHCRTSKQSEVIRTLENLMK